jgi:hypothetical protein
VASSVTLAQLRTDARLYADQRAADYTNAFIKDPELNRLMNTKARELYDMLVAARGSEYYATEATLAIVSGTSRYSLPADFYELSSVTLEWAPNYFELMFPIGTVRERVTHQNRIGINQVWTRYSRKGYQLRASQIEFLPIPTGSVTCRLQYVPVYVDMAADGDSFDGINGWEKMLTLGVACEMREIEKRPSATLANLYAEQMARIETMKTERDAEAAKEIVDVEALRDRYTAYGRTFGDSFGRTFG